ncbi:hypothetical protein S40285_01768 [Stachybotrys chlorohalonatus IBT 40285]|uniref:Uncharacterized protein n=2 Tax=Stachybotrys TaxID=74721 RepID=A0A084R293_STAC4|nr:hypothetical protein S7711_06825 [Stachybotrys chartarum IBT 7711]KFA50388.1 hypothetical protein S40293_05218 [Stachybotrys chartarum IBT 40293]KFA70328.1 hypothetical protein S40285_01768 [Stachybotrys chlorohalonata IBT 40285]KFA74706.1 hypothetical protein S40288_03949 [Stachybotrys chartarum IBT 40288]
MADNTNRLADQAQNLNPSTKPKIMDEQGAVGKQFTDKGAIGGAAERIGGPFDKEGVVGKQFTTDGSIGGSVQSALGGQKEK